MSGSKGRAGKAPVRPILAGSLSVDATYPNTVLSNSESSGKKPRRHSATTGQTASRDNKEVDGSLRKVSKWFRDFKHKMDPINFKRYARSSLVTQPSVTEEDEEVFHRQGKTATLRPRKPGKKALEKRFNSMECLPGSDPPPPAVVRKINSLQFEADSESIGLEEKGAEETDTNSSQQLETEDQQTDSIASLSAHFDTLTEDIARNLDEKEKILREIICLPSTNLLGQDETLDDSQLWPYHRRRRFKMKAGLLESAYLANELAHLINESIQPEHLFSRHQTTDASATETGNELEEKPTYVMVPLRLADVIDRLQNQLTSLLAAVERNSDELLVLRDEAKSALSFGCDQQLERYAPPPPPKDLLPPPTPPPPPPSPPTPPSLSSAASLTSCCEEKNSASSSVSDSECFLSLIHDLNEINN